MYMISLEACQTISPRRKPVRMRKRFRRRNMKTRWALSSHVYGPTLAVGDVGASLMRRTIEKRMGSTLLGAREWGPHGRRCRGVTSRGAARRGPGSRACGGPTV